MAYVPSLFVHPDYGIVFLLKLGSVTLLTLLRGNLRHTFLRVHISVSFICMVVLLLLLFLELVKRSRHYNEISTI